MLTRHIAQWRSRLLEREPAADEPTRRQLRARQIQAVLRLTPLLMTANLVNGAMVATAFWTTAPRWFMLPWCGGVTALVWRALAAWRRARRRPALNEASGRSIRHAEVHAAALAALWGVAPAMLFASADPAQQLLLATLTSGMIGAGGFALATIPTAGTLYVLLLSIGGAIGLASAPLSTAPYLAVLILVYGVTMIGSVWSSSRTFSARIRAEAVAARQHDVIGLLLRDFEESASDVLWEIDRDGRLRAPSDRLAELLGVPRSQLDTSRFVDLPLQRSMAMGVDELATDIKTLFSRPQAFRDALLCGGHGSRMRWMAVSAKPLIDVSGQVTGWRGVMSDVTERHLTHQRLTWLAHNDSLTGLANRYQFRARLTQLFALTANSTDGFAVIYVDIDHFKAINDTLGHMAGDAVLKIVAQRMLGIVRRTDLVARLGGDEFAVLLASTDTPVEVEQFVRRLLGVVAQPCEIAGTTHKVRCSAGVAMAPVHGRDVDTLLNHADLALYSAKYDGRNGVRFYVDEMAATTRRRLAIEEGLREAAGKGELHLVFQPKVEVRDRQVIGFETLLRWRHPQLDQVAPSEFVPIAEASGQMVAIGQWVLESACREAARWPRQVTVAVNISPEQAAAPDFVDHVLTALDRTGLAAERLELEITESALVKETDSTFDAMRRLRTAGCQITLDDFGTGYSALSYLRQFPFHSLKIDRSLVAGLGAGADAQAIVQMIIGMAQALALRTVAEGVEDLAQIDPLKRMGCDAAQGFALGRPMAADAVVPFLLTRPGSRSAQLH